jgi:hypothetical protein
MLQRCSVLCNSLLKHASVTMNMHTTIQELLGTVIINQFAPKLSSMPETELSDRGRRKAT